MAEVVFPGGVKPKPRVLSDRSVRELIDARERVGRELRAALYLYDDKLFLVSAITEIVEAGAPIVLSTSDSDELLGLAICDKLLEFGAHAMGDLRARRVDDWKVFANSGAKTVKQFEARTYYVGVETQNSAIIMRAQPRLSLEPCFYAGAMLSNGADHEKIGWSARRLIASAKTLRDADFI